MTGIIVLLCIGIIVGFFLDICSSRGGPEIQPPPSGPPPGDEPSE
jgi:hypothetical protein